MNQESVLNIKESTREHIVNLVRQFGDVTTDAILDPSCQIFTIPDVEGLIGYQVAGSHAVVLGDPVCALQEKAKLANAFHDYCKKQGFHITYFIVSEEFAKWLTQNLCSISIEYGEKILLDPLDNPKNKTGPKGSLVRRKTKRALKEGVSVEEYKVHNPELEWKIEQVGVSWLKNRRGPQIHISHARLFNDGNGKRWFYAKKNDHIVGILLLNKLSTKNGWLLNHVMVTPDASVGTTELLVTTALETVKKEGYSYVTAGVIPGEKLGEIVGLKSLSASFARLIFSTAQWIFHLDGHREFWGKFQPEKEKSFLVFSQKHISINSLKALMKVLNVTL